MVLKSEMRVAIVRESCLVEGQGSGLTQIWEKQTKNQFFLRGEQRWIERGVNQYSFK